MVKPEWGTKRTCASCEEHFYDLNNLQPACPKCGEVLDLSLSKKGKGKKSSKSIKVEDPKVDLVDSSLIDHIDDDDDDISDAIDLHTLSDDED